MTRRATLLCALGLLAGATSAARAHIPAPEIVARAAADASRAQGRNKPFAFAVSVHPPGASGAPVLARGELLAAPSGSARLELRHEDGFVERQLRSAGGLRAARDGEPLSAPHPLAPPLWLLQAAIGGDLLSRAAELGADPALIALGYDGARDCYVIGGADGGPSVWIDKDSYQVVRIDLADGTKYRFIAWASRGGAVLPGRIEIETPSASFELELTSATPAKPTPEAFSEAWLAAP